MVKIAETNTLSGNSCQLSNRLKEEYRKLLETYPGTEPWLVLEGDFGGQIYLTIPWKLVADSADILTLLIELDAFAWSCNEGEGGHAYFFSADEELESIHNNFPEQEVGIEDISEVCGGMGGGSIIEDLWLHDEFREGYLARAKALLGAEG